MDDMKKNHKKIKKVCVKYGKHKWERNEDGSINIFAWENGFCNGVYCENCGKIVCVHCEPDYKEEDDCEDIYYMCPTCGKKYFNLRTARTICKKCGQSFKGEEEITYDFTKV